MEIKIIEKIQAFFCRIGAHRYMWNPEPQLPDICKDCGQKRYRKQGKID